MNPKAETVEELQGRRKHLHMGMLKLAREDAALTLTAASDTFSVHRPCPFSHATVWYPLHRLCCAALTDLTGATIESGAVTRSHGP